MVPALARRWQTGGVPAPLSILIAFALIAGLAIVLRWTYGSELTARRYRISDDQPSSPDEYPVLLVDDEPDGRHDALDPAPAEALLAAAEPADERYGLLRAVLVAENRRQANAVQELLREAGIRSTLAADRAGVRVLVFPESLDEARRLLRPN